MKRAILYILAFLCCSLAGLGQRVMMIGDSHVAGKTYPRTVDSLLSLRVDSCRFSWYGINGAAFSTFCKPGNLDSIYAHRPEILIVHLGTNDSYCRTFNRATVRQNMMQFYDAVHDSLPEVKMVFVTPFVNKLKRTIRTKKKRRRTVWDVNHNTDKCADLIADFCRERPDAWCINHHAAHGMEFLQGPYIYKDWVHLLVPGYELLGTQVFDELIRIPELFPSAKDE